MPILRRNQAYYPILLLTLTLRPSGLRQLEHKLFARLHDNKSASAAPRVAAWGPVAGFEL